MQFSKYRVLACPSLSNMSVSGLPAIRTRPFIPLRGSVRIYTAEIVALHAALALALLLTFLSFFC
jgi:hypothetical protein